MAEDEVLEGFSGCARAVNKAFSLEGEAGLDRRDLERWTRRRATVRNADGLPPPETAVPPRRHVKRTRPRLLWRPGDWVEWVRPGIPAPGSSQRAPRFETPDGRRERYARAPVDLGDDRMVW